MLERETPPEVPWPSFINEQADLIRAEGLKLPPEGIHLLFVGQTRSGKTTLKRIMSRLRRATVVFGTKPGRDSSLEKYIAEGFTRIDHWPPTKKELRPRGPYEQVKLLLWPAIKAYPELQKYNDVYRRAAEHMLVEANWNLDIDELRWVCGRDGLKLGDIITQIAVGGASNGTSLSMAIQRPSAVPIETYASSHHDYIFKLGNTNDIRELASYSAYSTREVSDAIRGLNKGNLDKGHQFLHLPVVGGASWKISEVPKDWA